MLILQLSYKKDNPIYIFFSMECHSDQSNRYKFWFFFFGDQSTLLRDKKHNQFTMPPLVDITTSTNAVVLGGGQEGELFVKLQLGFDELGERDDQQKVAYVGVEHLSELLVGHVRHGVDKV